ncbi:hypothetical protein CGK15_13935 [Vibrio parahaemolyticus]|nr:hypothetical protein CGK25_08840 [Vibrio parahaemolyticus]TOA97995.1 hypothetical protein CGK15_13935 [Vibrio parahaemolyticus]
MKEMTKKDRYTAFFLGVFFLLLSLTLLYIGISKSYNFANFIMESRPEVIFNQIYILSFFGSSVFLIFSFMGIFSFIVGRAAKAKERNFINRLLIITSLLTIISPYPSLLLIDEFAKNHGFQFDKSESSYNLLLETRIYKLHKE